MAENSGKGVRIGDGVRALVEGESPEVGTPPRPMIFINRR
jgi:hypothetical protein